ncbi:MAG: GDYXXLXY domain-containing protein [Bacillaceae bacterium]|nr:GDYXXLXY domain-containing protein [Bacillaceae bacterium]
MKRVFFYVVTGLQALFLIAMSVSFYIMDDFGEVIRLETAPIDPPDLFYGDYVSLRYEEERIEPEYWFGSKEVDRNEKIYVLLIPDEEGIYHVKAASDKKLAEHDDGIVITAKYQYKDWNGDHRVSFGINRFYVEDNTGRQYEEIRDQLIVTVVVVPWGQKKIVSLEPKSS